MTGLLPELTLLDRVGLGWFLLAWLGYGQLIHGLSSPRSITARLRGVRRSWMQTMLNRDNRITDASLIGHTLHSATFFASTTMITLAALLGVLGNFAHVFTALGELAFTARTPRLVAEAKVLLLVLVFAHTFLKLTWAIRQLNYCIALIGAAPQKPPAEERDVLAERVAAVLSLAVSGFNAGVRGYYFAFAVLSWLVGPGTFLITTTGIVSMLLWRQFGSETAGAMRSAHAVLVKDAPRASPPAQAAVQGSAAARAGA